MVLSPEITQIPRKWDADHIVDLSNKVYLVTGANSGIGFETTRELVKKNATVIMACRNLKKGKAAIDLIREMTPNGKMDLINLDLANLTSIATIANKIKANYKYIHGLLNNAGIFYAPKVATSDNFELHIGINHLGHFALTASLFEIILKTKGSRIITQSSFVHRMGRINVDDIHFSHGYTRTKAYTQSKLANLLFALELDRRLKQRKIDTMSLATHPGMSRTNLFFNGPLMNGKTLWYPIHKLANLIWAQSAYMGALPLLYAATSENLSGGEYIGPQYWFGTRGYPKIINPSKKALDVDLSKRLWDLSCRILEIPFLV